jgi:hypothetical protein
MMVFLPDKVRYFCFNLIKFAATPGPGSYTLPSEFGQLILPRKDENSSQMGQSRIGSML